MRAFWFVWSVWCTGLYASFELFARHAVVVLFFGPGMEPSKAWCLPMWYIRPVCVGLGTDVVTSRSYEVLWVGLGIWLSVVSVGLRGLGLLGLW